MTSVFTLRYTFFHFGSAEARARNDTQRGAVSKHEREGESALPLPPRTQELDEQSRLADHDAAYLAGQSPSLPPCDFRVII